MDKHRQVAFILAFIVAMVIMMIGKSCTDSTMEKKNPKPVMTDTSQGIHENPYVNSYNNNNNYNNSYNNSENNAVQTAPPVETQPSVIYVTNMLGDVVGTETNTTVPVQPVTDSDGIPQVETVQPVTERKSVLDEYNDEVGKNENPFKKSDSGNQTNNNNSYTVPSEIKITIN